MKFAEAIGALLFKGNRWANTSLIQPDPLCKSFFIFSGVFTVTRSGVYHFSCGMQVGVEGKGHFAIVVKKNTLGTEVSHIKVNGISDCHKGHFH